MVHAAVSWAPVRPSNPQRFRAAGIAVPVLRSKHLSGSARALSKGWTERSSLPAHELATSGGSSFSYAVVRRVSSAGNHR